MSKLAFLGGLRGLGQGITQVATDRAQQDRRLEEMKAKSEIDLARERTIARLNHGYQLGQIKYEDELRSAGRTEQHNYTMAEIDRRGDVDARNLELEYGLKGDESDRNNWARFVNEASQRGLNFPITAPDGTVYDSNPDGLIRDQYYDVLRPGGGRRGTTPGTGNPQIEKSSYFNQMESKPNVDLGAGVMGDQNTFKNGIHLLNSTGQFERVFSGTVNRFREGVVSIAGGSPLEAIKKIGGLGNHKVEIYTTGSNEPEETDYNAIKYWNGVWERELELSMSQAGNRLNGMNNFARKIFSALNSNQNNRHQIGIQWPPEFNIGPDRFVKDIYIPVELFDTAVQFAESQNELIPEVMGLGGSAPASTGGGVNARLGYLTGDDIRGGGGQESNAPASVPAPTTPPAPSDAASQIDIITDIVNQGQADADRARALRRPGTIIGPVQQPSTPAPTPAPPTTPPAPAVDDPVPDQNALLQAQARTQQSLMPQQQAPQMPDPYRQNVTATHVPPSTPAPIPAPPTPPPAASTSKPGTDYTATLYQAGAKGHVSANLIDNSDSDYVFSKGQEFEIGSDDKRVSFSGDQLTYVMDLGRNYSMSLGRNFADTTVAYGFNVNQDEPQLVEVTSSEKKVLDDFFKNLLKFSVLISKTPRAPSADVRKRDAERGQEAFTRVVLTMANQQNPLDRAKFFKSLIDSKQFQTAVADTFGKSKNPVYPRRFAIPKDYMKYIKRTIDRTGGSYTAAQQSGGILSTAASRSN